MKKIIITFLTCGISWAAIFFILPMLKTEMPLAAFFTFLFICDIILVVGSSIMSLSMAVDITFRFFEEEKENPLDDMKFRDDLEVLIAYRVAVELEKNEYFQNKNVSRETFLDKEFDLIPIKREGESKNGKKE